MRSFFVILGLLATIAFSSADFESDWVKFKVDFGRHYKSSEEESFRKNLFRNTWENVEELNKKYEKGEISWKAGINNFADMTDEEKRQYLGVLFPHKKNMDALRIELLNSSNQFESDWTKFKVDFGRHYKSAEEETFRKEIFHKTWQMVQEINEKYEKGEISWKAGINNFADMTDEEKRQHMGVLIPHKKNMDALSTELLTNSDKFIFDWAKFKVDFNRHYKSAEEESFRKDLFRKTWEMVQEHNKKYESGEVSWKMGINRFADRTIKEKRQFVGVLFPHKRLHSLF